MTFIFTRVFLEEQLISQQLKVKRKCLTDGFFCSDILNVLVAKLVQFFRLNKVGELPLNPLPTPGANGDFVYLILDHNYTADSIKVVLPKP